MDFYLLKDATMYFGLNIFMDLIVWREYFCKETIFDGMFDLWKATKLLR